MTNPAILEHTKGFMSFHLPGHSHVERLELSNRHPIFWIILLSVIATGLYGFLSADTLKEIASFKMFIISTPMNGFV
jgi:hypothetical protein